MKKAAKADKPDDGRATVVQVASKAVVMLATDAKHAKATLKSDTLAALDPTMQSSITSSSSSSSSSSQQKRERNAKKFLQFYENYRPAWWGVWPEAPKERVRCRNPRAKYTQVDYENDSEAEWGDDAEDGDDCDSEDEEDGEDDDDDDEGDDDGEAAAAAARRRRADGLEEDGFLLPESEDEDAVSSNGDKKKDAAAAASTFEPEVLGPVLDWNVAGKNEVQLTAMRELGAYRAVTLSHSLWNHSCDFDLPMPYVPRGKRSGVTASASSAPAIKSSASASSSTPTAFAPSNVTAAATVTIKEEVHAAVDSAHQKQPQQQAAVAAPMSDVINVPQVRRKIKPTLVEGPTTITPSVENPKG